MSPEQAVVTILGDDAPQPGLPPIEISAEPMTTKPTRRREQKKRTTQKNKPPILRSYVPSPDAEPATGEAGDKAGRSPVDVAGVGHVLNYERASGRIPKEMPHKNPGYDIESRDAEGRILRYIEVKSISGSWTNTYAVLSKPQFDAASQFGDAFWLYVVARAQTDAFTIHRIQNPPGQANHFMFDDGWRAVAEADESKEGTPEEEEEEESG